MREIRAHWRRNTQHTSLWPANARGVPSARRLWGGGANLRCRLAALQGCNTTPPRPLLQGEEWQEALDALESVTSQVGAAALQQNLVDCAPPLACARLTATCACQHQLPFHLLT